MPFWLVTVLPLSSAYCPIKLSLPAVTLIVPESLDKIPFVVPAMILSLSAMTFVSPVPSDFTPFSPAVKKLSYFI